MILPRLSLVWDLEDVIHFFVQVGGEILYATVQQIGGVFGEWKLA